MPPAGDRIAATPQPVWFGDRDRTDTLAVDVDRHVAAAATKGALPVMVAYAIPSRDCGGCSAGRPRAGQFWPEYPIGLAQRAP